MSVAKSKMATLIIKRIEHGQAQSMNVVSFFGE